MRISEVLQAKPSQEIVTISPDAGVRELIALLDEKNVGALIVSSDGTTLQGIVSERDVVRHLHRDGTGEFFPLTDYADELGEGTVEEALDALVAHLLAYAGQEMNDDMALVLAERTGA